MAGNENGRGSRSADLADPRTSLIIGMKRDYRTLEEMKQRLSGEGKKISRERIRQILNEVVAIHGARVVKPEIPAWCAHAAAGLLRKEGFVVSRAKVIAICEGGNIDRIDRPRQDMKFLITRKGLSQVRRRLRTMDIRTCSECGNEFTIRCKGAGFVICSKQCRKAREKRHYQERGKHPPDPQRMFRLHRAIVRALPIMGSHSATSWIRRKAALEVAEITTTQLEYLRAMHIIMTRDDPARTWRGRPCRLYSAEEMRIVRRVFCRYRGKKRRR